jgi:transposase
MGGENLQELVKRQAEIITAQAKTITKLEARISGLEALVAELRETIARLQKDSRNSSKPPSSDIVKPKAAPTKTNGADKRNIGGQKGHKRHGRMPFPPEQAGKFIDATLPKCPSCGGELEKSGKEVIKNRQIEIAEKPFIVTEYRQHSYWCPNCQSCHTAPLPEEGRSGLFSISLIAVAAYLKGRCHISFSALKDFFHEVLGIKASRGFLAKQAMKAGASLKETHGS